MPIARCARILRFVLLLVLIAFGGAATGGNRIIGAQAPNGGAHLVKHFSVPTGALVGGVTFQSNEVTTVFPKVMIVQGPIEQLSDGVRLAEATDVRPNAEGRVTITFPPIRADSWQDLYVAIALPTSAGVTPQGTGAGILAAQLKAPGDSYYVDGEAHLGEMDVEYEIELVYQTSRKTTPFDGIDTPAVAALRLRPNPFNPAVTLEFSVPAPAFVEANVYDVAGRLIAVLVQEQLTPGVYRHTWGGYDQTGKSVPSGIYLASVRVGDVILTEKLTLMK